MREWLQGKYVLAKEQPKLVQALGTHKNSKPPGELMLMFLYHCDSFMHYWPYQTLWSIFFPEKAFCFYYLSTLESFNVLFPRAILTIIWLNDLLNLVVLDFYRPLCWWKWHDKGNWGLNIKNNLIISKFIL